MFNDFASAAAGVAGSISTVGNLPTVVEQITVVSAASIGLPSVRDDGFQFRRGLGDRLGQHPAPAFGN